MLAKLTQAERIDFFNQTAQKTKINLVSSLLLHVQICIKPIKKLMSEKLLNVMALTVLLVSMVTNAMENILSARSIDFVVTADADETLEEYSFSLHSTATLFDLQQVIESQCGLHDPFEIQLLGQRICVSSQPATASNQIIAAHPGIVSTWLNLAELWGPTSHFRIPLKVLPFFLNQDTAVYVSLRDMFIGDKSNVHEFEWYQYIQQCAGSTSCSIQNLCDRFHEHFRCKDKALREIKLDRQKLKGIIDLSALPSTVTKLNVERNSLTEIIGLERLNGKKLQTLKIRKNALEIDLEPLIRSPLSVDNPLRTMWIMAPQISRSLHVDPGFDEGDVSYIRDNVLCAAKEWINFSVLDRITMGWETCRSIQRVNHL